ncbi:MAG: hypothetical protein IPF60_05965 [Betaproteobacteria bacterium]|nr:hypothetical protein [Betaproteobacteria bacterium]
MRADLVVLDLAATPLLSWRIPFGESVEDVLAVLMMLGDYRLVAATCAGGRLVHRRRRPQAGRPLSVR